MWLSRARRGDGGVLGCSSHGHGAVHPGGYGQADGDEDDAQDHRSPAEYQARKCQSGPLFTGAPDLVAGHVAEHDRRDGRQRPEGELRETAGKAGAMASPLVLAGVVTMVAADGLGTAACAAGRSATTWSRSA